MNDYECEAQNNRLKVGFLLIPKGQNYHKALHFFTEGTKDELYLIHHPLLASSLHLFPPPDVFCLAADAEIKHVHEHQDQKYKQKRHC